jgi:hypothetical protein
MTDETKTPSPKREWRTPQLKRLGEIREIAGPNPRGRQSANFKT